MLKKTTNYIFQKMGTVINTVRAIRYKNEQYIDLACYIPKIRIPDAIFTKSSVGIQKNSEFLAGYSYIVDVKTDTLEICITYNRRRIFSNMSPRATSGLDIYQQDGDRLVWIACMVPQNRNGMYVREKVSLLNNSGKVVLFWPSYASVKNVFIKSGHINGLITDDTRRSIALYGSSITQGCAASRPGLNYGNILAAEYGYKIFNYGFSESAKGEADIIEHIAKQMTDVVVLEYDHNATIEELEKTHKRAYITIRKHNSQCHIIFLSRISGGISISDKEEESRYSIIQSSYLFAKANCDNRVSIIRGRDLVKGNAKYYLADDRHPNDEGMRLIADTIAEIIEKEGK